MILVNDLLDHVAPPPSYESVLAAAGVVPSDDGKTQGESYPPGKGGSIATGSSSRAACTPDSLAALTDQEVAYLQEANTRSAPIIWLLIVQQLLSGSPEEEAEGRAALHRQIRFVCRGAYLASMSLLRSHYLSSYLASIRPLFTANPTPAHSARQAVSKLFNGQEALDVLKSLALPKRRETKVLDLFVAAEVKRDIQSFESDLLDQPEIEGLFDLHQPRARLEDLVIDGGLQRGCLAARQGIVRKVVAECASEKSAPAEGSSAPQAGATVRVRGTVLSEDLTLIFTLKRVDVRLPFVGTSSSSSVMGSGTADADWSLSGPAPSAASQQPMLVRKAILSVGRSRATALEETAQLVLEQLELGTADVRLVLWSNPSSQGLTQSEAMVGRRGTRRVVAENRHWSWYEAEEGHVQAKARAPAHPQSGSHPGAGSSGSPSKGGSSSRSRFSRWLRKS